MSVESKFYRETMKIFFPLFITPENSDESQFETRKKCNEIFNGLCHTSSDSDSTVRRLLGVGRII